MVVDGTVIQPLRTVINGKYDGAFLFMPAYAPELDAAAMKVINIFPHNIDNGIYDITGADHADRRKDGSYVTRCLGWNLCDTASYRSSIGAAFDLLAKKECRIGALIGTGGQAATQLEAMLAARKLEEVRVFDLNLSVRKNLPKECRRTGIWNENHSRPRIFR